LCLRGVGREVNAGNPRRRQELRETPLSGCRTQWHSIEQDLIARSPKQQPSVPAFIERSPQFFPCSLKLRGRSHVPKFVQARKLQQNVQGANKRSSSRSGVARHFLRIAWRDQSGDGTFRMS
jgi:hypothetical protein